MKKSFLPIDSFFEEPYSSIIAFPKGTKRQIFSRVTELEKLGIEKISFQGELKLGKISVLGKGYVGIVILAKKQRKKVALKIRRIDSQRKEMKSEGALLRLANKAGVGPELIASSRNFLVMEFLDGKKIGSWVKTLKGRGSSATLKSALRKVLENCFYLDKNGIDHGELSSISKHVMVSKAKTTLVDFESASIQRKVSNVTSATQGIFIGSGLSKTIRRISSFPQNSEIIKKLRNYKQEKTQHNFDKLLELLRL